MTILILCDKCHYCFYTVFLQYGRTALHIASTNGHLEVVNLLLQSDSDVNVKNNVSTELPQ